MSYSLLRLVQKFNSLQTQVNNVVSNLKNFTLLNNFNLLKSQINTISSKLDINILNLEGLKSIVNVIVQNIPNFITSNDLKVLLNTNFDTFITITDPLLHVSIFQSNPKIILKINNEINNIVIPSEMVEGQSIQFYNLSSNLVSIICFVSAYNTFYSPNGTTNYIMSPYTVFTFHLVIDSDGNKLFIVN
jgi:hypothetical protein